MFIVTDNIESPDPLQDTILLSAVVGHLLSQCVFCDSVGSDRIGRCILGYGSFKIAHLVHSAHDHELRQSVIDKTGKKTKMFLHVCCMTLIVMLEAVPPCEMDTCIRLSGFLIKAVSATQYIRFNRIAAYIHRITMKIHSRHLHASG